MNEPVTANGITAELLVQIPKRFQGARVWRRNVGQGVGWDTAQGVIRLIRANQPGPAIRLLQSRPVKFGLAGEGDLDGIVPIGGLGVRLCIEVKAGRDVVREAQLNFRDMIIAAGGLYVLARTVEQGLADLEREVASHATAVQL